MQLTGQKTIRPQSISAGGFFRQDAAFIPCGSVIKEQSRGRSPDSSNTVLYSPSPFAVIVMKSCAFVMMERAERLPRSASLFAVNSEMSTQ